MKLTPKPTFLIRLCCAAIALAYPILILGQENSQPKRNTPFELRAADPQIQNLVEEARSDAGNGDIDEAIATATRAFETAVQKKLLGDEAITDSVLASVYIAKGKFDEGLKHLHKALQEAIDSGNLVLEADILTSLSVEAQIKGDWQSAIAMTRKAADLAEEAHNLFEKSRALGMLGYLLLLSGKTEEARIPIENALEIDRINQYEFMASHLVYQGYYLIATGKLDASVEVLNQASEKAIEHSDLLSFVLAKIALANIYGRKGETNEAIQLLESIRQGKLDSSKTAPEMNRKLAAALSAPLPRISLLEGLGAVYESAGRPEKALPVWGELYSFSESIGLLVAKAESAKKVADLNAQLKRTQEALRYYSTALASFRQLQNEPLLLQTLISESLLLVQVGKGEEAIPLTEEVVELTKRRNLRPLQFSAYLVMAEIYQPMGDLVNARAVLEKAQALVQPGPSDPAIDNKQLLEAYNRLGDIYREQHNTAKELIEAEKGFEIAHLLKDQDNEAHLVKYIERRFRETKIYEEAQKAESEGRLEDALVLSEIIFVVHGAPAGPDTDANWNRVENLPFQVVQRPDGARVLTEIITEMGSLLGTPRYAILDALCRYYLGTGARPDLAEHFALQLEASLKDVGDSLDFLKARAACDLTMAYAYAGKSALAKGKASECMSLADKTNQQQTKDFANVANVKIGRAHV
jgi:tetratricopeptide (TPR) repeat protein